MVVVGGGGVCVRRVCGKGGWKGGGGRGVVFKVQVHHAMPPCSTRTQSSRTLSLSAEPPRSRPPPSSSARFGVTKGWERQLGEQLGGVGSGVQVP
jgi:hypothetical protein